MNLLEFHLVLRSVFNRAEYRTSHLYKKYSENGIVESVRE